MAEKSSNRTQGRSRPQAQAKGQNRSSQKQNPDSGRGGGTNGATGAKGRAQDESRQRNQGSSGGRQPAEQEDESQQSGGITGAAGKVGDTLKQHPITTAALGAGLTLLAAQGIRMAMGAGNGSGQGEEEDDSAQASREGQDEGDEGEQDEDARASGSAEGNEDEGEGGGGGRLGRLGSKFGSAFRGSGDAIRRGAQSGYERGRQGAEQGWQNHPLLFCGLALAVGATAGLLLPRTRQEDKLMGKTSDKVAGRVKKGGQAFFRQGRSIAGKALNEAVETTAREVEREGLSPDRLGKKFKRVFNHVRDAVSEAVQEE